HWVFIGGRGWCWVPGNWHGWHTGPTWVNAPPGFRAPAPPPANKIVVNTPPGGRVQRTNTTNDIGHVGVRNPGSGHSGGGPPFNHEGRGGSRGNRRVFPNDDVARVPRRDAPKDDAPAQPAPGVIDADRKPKQVDRPPVNDVQRQPGVDRFHGDRQPPAS